MATIKQIIEHYHDVWVFCEVRDKKIMPVSLELINEGKNLAKTLNERLCVILLGKAVREVAEELLYHGVDIVYLVEGEIFEYYTTEAYTTAVSTLIEKYKPAIVLYGATHIGRDLAPRIAARINTGLTADCTALAIDEQSRNLQQTRPAFGGNLMATILCPENRPQMSTVRPGVFEKSERSREKTGQIITEDMHIENDEIRTKVLQVVKLKKEMESLADAKIIIAGGNGIGCKESFELLSALAKKLNGTIAASRAAVDAGWIEHDRQVGQTGCTVKPDLYIAFGISGAVQHLAGMHNAKKIVAVNTNKNAPIFEIAHYGLVGDWKEIATLMLAQF